MFANRFTAVVDACVLAGVAKRDLILSLADAELFRVRWSYQVMTETEKAINGILRDRGYNAEDSKERAAHALKSIQAAFPEAAVEGHADLTDKLDCLPDKDDHHVLAAAIHCKASVIVTDNLKDFPKKVLELYEIEPKSADEFIADTVDLDYRKSLAAIAALRARLKNPELTASELLERWRAQGLQKTAECLNPHLDDI